jgi:MFS superfamily sulfate permease-like transporter
MTHEPVAVPADGRNGELSFVDILKRDALSSIVVFLVALPLCMGIAIASGVPMERAAAVGLITGIVGGVIVGLISGCPLQVSGPAAGLAVIVAQLIGEHGLEKLGIIVLLAGLIQLASGLAGLGQWFRAVSPAVIQGMLAGIGMLIFAGQFHVMLDDKPPGTGKDFGGIINLATIPQAVWKGINEGPHQVAAGIGIFTIVAIAAWTMWCPKKLKALPAPLIGVVLATVAATVLNLQMKYIDVPERLSDVILWPTWESVTSSLNGSIFVAALALAFVASAESLLTATAVDAMQTHAPRTKYDRELWAQGVGNMICGAVGALPITGVIVRSAANVQAGGRTRASTIMHGLWILVFVLLLPAVLRLVPVSCLAAVLVFTGVKLMNPQAVRKLAEFGKGEVAVYAATFGTVVGIDLLTGVIVGICLALARLLYKFSHLEMNIDRFPREKRTVMHLNGTATFVRLPKLAAALETIAHDTELHVHFENLAYIDHACLNLLMNWEKEHQAMGGRLVIDWEGLTAKFREYGKQNGRRDEHGIGEAGSDAAAA